MLFSDIWLVHINLRVERLSSRYLCLEAAGLHTIRNVRLTHTIKATAVGRFLHPEILKRSALSPAVLELQTQNPNAPGHLPHLIP